MKTTKEIIARLQEGNKLAFQSVYDSYAAHIYNFIHSLLYNAIEAEDLTQEVFIKVWEHKAQLNPQKNFDSYIFTIARNLVYDQWEARLHAEQYLNSVEPKAYEASVAQPEEQATIRSLGEYVDRLIDKLPPARKEIFLLSRQQHLPTREIARRLSISERTVETQIYRSLQFLRKHLTDEGILTWLLLLLR